MIEIVENIFQLIVTGSCGVYGIYKSITQDSREWLLAGLFSAAFFSGDFYWSLYILFYGDSPQLSYVSEFSWYASYIFLIMLIQVSSTPEQRKLKHRALIVVPIFVVGMCIYFMTMGDYFSNITTAVLMGILMYYSLQGIIYHKNDEDGRRCIFIAAFTFCVVEYLLWILSVIWIGGNTALNPYYWCDMLLSISILMVLLAVRKAVKE